MVMATYGIGRKLCLDALRGRVVKHVALRCWMCPPVSSTKPPTAQPEYPWKLPGKSDLVIHPNQTNSPAASHSVRGAGWRTSHMPAFTEADPFSDRGWSFGQEPGTGACLPA